MAMRIALTLVLVSSLVGCGDDSPAEDDVTDDVETDGGRDRDGGSGDGGTPASCGDLMCEGAETCSSCEADCGECPEPVITECNDGIDNDGDGLVDWQMDVGCWSEADATEAAGPRGDENGFTTFDLDADSQLVYVSNEGDDANDGLTPETAVATPQRGAELVRDGFPDFLLFRRGDSWRGMTLGDGRVARRFKSGRDAEHRLVVGSYGDSTERPRFEVDTHFFDDDGNGRSFLAFVGLAFVSYPKIPGDPDFDGASGGAIRVVGAESRDILLEDNYVEYGEFVLQNATDLEVRHNVVWRSYHVGTCAYNADGSPNLNGSSEFRPSGIFAGGVDGLVIEGNVWDENGYNPDVAEACATIYNHDLYLSGNDRLVVRDNLILRASSIGLKMAANSTGASQDILIENNLFAEGEIGLGMGGNDDSEYRFVDARVLHNVFTDIGRVPPTMRNLSWFLGLQDNDGTEVRGNLLVNQREDANGFGIHLASGSMRNVTLVDNVIEGIDRRAIWIEPEGSWDGIRVTGNRVVSATDTACLITHEGDFGAVTYADGAYASGAAADERFCVDGARMSFDDWVSASGETGASESPEASPDPGRNLDGYASHLGIGSTIGDFAAAARQQSRHAYRPELTAPNANNWIRAGYGVAPR